MTTTFEPKDYPIIFQPEMVRALLRGEKTQTRRTVKVGPGGNAVLGASSLKHHDHDWDRAEIRPDLMLALMTEGDVRRPTLHVPFRHKADAWEANPADDAVDRVYPRVHSGDRLWVKESVVLAPPNWGEPIDATATDDEGRPRHLTYFADHGLSEATQDYGLKVTPSIFMPRWASRLTLRVTEVRVQRLHEISEEDAVAEGVGGLVMRSYDHERGDWYDADEFRAFDPIRKYRLLWDVINGVGSWRSNPFVFAYTFERVECEVPT